ncbi:ubiquitin-specific protease Doa4 [Malassezia pachydermatis]|uniref:Ubiquitin carboxyl-terminal hydrolase n=1 Tax=Malassezia pachydermatis TaxID=77020 RepID=A0A0M9VRF5_9BASI|nr:cysteine proteinase [Malassezia pachydermatis]KOS16565.1 cysteine proteinase [Malassezia pachydermatis]
MTTLPAQAVAVDNMDPRLPPYHPTNLRKQVHLALDPSFSVKSYIGAAATLLDKAQMADAQGHLEAAFVHYLTTASVASFVPKHAEWAEVKQQRGATFLAYQELMNRTPDIVQRAQAIEKELLARAESDMAEATTSSMQTLAITSRETSASSTPSRQSEESIRSHSAEMARTRSSSPSKTPASLVPGRPRKPPPPLPPSAGTTRVAPPVGEVLSVEDVWTLMYPGFDKSVDQSGRELLQKRASCSVLLIDVRSRAEHEAGHIRGADTICIDPALLRAPPVPFTEVQAALPPKEAEFCAKCSQYDLLVLYDQQTRTWPTPGTATPEQVTLMTIQDMLEREKLPPPALLRGGFASWARQVGDCGVIANRPPSLAPSGQAAPRPRPTAPSPVHSTPTPSPPPRAYVPGRQAPASISPPSSQSQPRFAYPTMAPTQSSAASVPTLMPPPVSVPPPRTPASLVAGSGAMTPRTIPSPRAREPKVGLSGLKNMGQTCYMNATMQCLSASTILSQYMLDGSFQKAINTQNPLGTQGAVAKAVASLLRTLWSEQYAAVTPSTFRQVMGRVAPMFRGNEQQDSQEFLVMLLDGLHEDLNLVLQRPPMQELGEAQQAAIDRLPQQLASVVEWSMYRQRNDSIIVHSFQGQLRNQLACLTCGHTSTTYNAFMSLSLPIPQGRGISQVRLLQCLDSFVQEEVLEKANAWHCPKCKKPRRSTKRLSLARLPPILIVHLKRFMHRGSVTKKIETPVTFPIDGLDLTNYMPPPLPPGTSVRGVPVSESQRPPYLYDLYAVTHHFGTLSSGHYTASIRTQGTWYYCDDSVISQSDAQLRTASPYVLFYRRRMS